MSRFGWWAAPLGVAVALAVASCGSDEPPAVTAARAFVDAARLGDVEEILTMVDRATAARVAQAAERASDQVGGRRSLESPEMLQVVDVDPRFQVAEAELSHGDDTQAVVQLTGADGSTHALQMVNEDGAWRVRLPAPQGAMGQP